MFINLSLVSRVENHKPSLPPAFHSRWTGRQRQADTPFNVFQMAQAGKWGL